MAIEDNPEYVVVVADNKTVGVDLEASDEDNKVEAVEFGSASPEVLLLPRSVTKMGVRGATPSPLFGPNELPRIAPGENNKMAKTSNRQCR